MEIALVISATIIYVCGLSLWFDSLGKRTQNIGDSKNISKALQTELIIFLALGGIFVVNAYRKSKK